MKQDVSKAFQFTFFNIFNDLGAIKPPGTAPANAKITEKVEKMESNEGADAL